MISGCLDIAVDAAREAGDTLAEMFAMGVRAEPKGRFDLVTEADRAAEAIVLRRIRSAFPTHHVVAEESGSHAGCSTGYCWHIDPLDGTKNFTHGYPAFSVSIALECAGELVIGVVYEPIRREMFAAERSAGAFCNNRRLCVSPVNRLDECLVTTGFPSARRHSPSSMTLFSRIALTTQGLRRTGSSALDLGYVASGRVDAFWDVGLNTWDVAAGLVLVAEAGGCYSDLQGGRYALGCPDLLADNGALHDQLVRLFTCEEEHPGDD